MTGHLPPGCPAPPFWGHTGPFGPPEAAGKARAARDRKAGLDTPPRELSAALLGAPGSFTGQDAPHCGGAPPPREPSDPREGPSGTWPLSRLSAGNPAFRRAVPKAPRLPAGSPPGFRGVSDIDSHRLMPVGPPLRASGPPWLGEGQGHCDHALELLYRIRTGKRTG